jgi:hypothetical protein
VIEPCSGAALADGREGAIVEETIARPGRHDGEAAWLSRSFVHDALTAYGLGEWDLTIPA